MQSRRITLLRLLLIVLIIATAARAEVLRVPQEYGTIQAALDVVGDEDTVLVALGTYAEALLAPPLRFWLMGDVEIDTGDFARPEIDPSTLDSAQWRRCLTVPDGCELTVERMAFRNRAPMYPRSDMFNWGGVFAGSRLPFTCRFCVFDSTWGGITAWPNIFTPVHYVVEDCQFRNGTRSQLVAGADSSRLDVRRSLFHGRGCALVAGSGDSTRIEDCVLRGDSMIYNPVTLIGAGWIMRNCDVGPMDRAQQIVRAGDYGNSIIEGNVFHDLLVNRAVLLHDHLSGGPTVIRHNVFQNNTAWQDYPLQTSAPRLFTSTTSCEQAICTAIVDSNIFRRNRAGTDTLIYDKAILAFKGVSLTGNRFSDLWPPTSPCIEYSGSPNDTIHLGGRLRYNFFEAGDFAVGSWYDSVDAILNYWGHASGPYNAVYNPEGEGAAIDNLVQFDPWSPDTNFFPDTTVSADLRNPLPEQFEFSVFPNPFNSIVHFTLTPAEVRLANVKLYDILGREVAEVWRGPLAFRKEINFDASGLASGIYFVRVADTISRKQMAMQKLVLLK